ncbi:MAG: protein kinase [Firmicutes bacterium]|nr:protein kinase [Bacillota bacterium]
MSDPLDSYRPGSLIRQLSDRYAFKGILGRGGSGLVFEVENLKLKRREALKLFHQSFAKDGSRRFAQEARIMASLDHAHILPIYSFGEEEGTLWFAMKLVEGPTLSRYLKTVHRLNPGDALKVAVPLLEALSVTHARGVVHRDIKPANILLDPMAGAFLSDFGIAKSESDGMRTETGTFLGTPAYISPEQGLGQRVDGRSDVYAMGMVLYEMLAGRLPFDEGNTLAVVLQRFQMKAPSLGEHRPDLPAALIEVVDKALERSAEDRFSTASSMVEALKGVAREQGFTSQGVLTIPPGMYPPREPLPAEWTPVAATDSVQTPSALPLDDPTSSTIQRAIPAFPETRQRRIPLWLGLAAAVAVIAWLGVGRMRAKLQAAPPPGVTESLALKSDPVPPSTMPVAAAAPVKNTVAADPRKENAVIVRRAVTPPQLVEPPWTDPAMKAECKGKSISVIVEVDTTGRVYQARLPNLSQVDPACAEAAIKAARACHFKPALAADGQPVNSTTAISIDL